LLRCDLVPFFWKKWQHVPKVTRDWVQRSVIVRNKKYQIATLSCRSTEKLLFWKIGMSWRVRFLVVSKTMKIKTVNSYQNPFWGD
jgi:hypothetical protein